MIESQQVELYVVRTKTNRISSFMLFSVCFIPFKCVRFTNTGGMKLSERSDEGVPLPEVVRVMVQVWEREGVN